MNLASKLLAVFGLGLALATTSVSRADVPPPEDAGAEDAALADAAEPAEDATIPGDASAPAEDAAAAVDASPDAATTTPESDSGCSVAGSENGGAFALLGLGIAAVISRRRAR